MEKFEKLTAAAAPMPASNIDTDIIMPKAFLKRIDKEGVLEGLFHDVRLYEDGREREDFVLNQPAYRNAKILVTGPNFGCGSSREHAPLVIKTCGTGCVIAKSFARIFYRNAINIGLPILECEEAAEEISAGDEVKVDFDTGIITDMTTGKTYKAQPFPPFIQNIIKCGGLLKSLKEGAQNG